VARNGVDGSDGVLICRKSPRMLSSTIITMFRNGRALVGVTDTACRGPE
jgi:hypothetical protein